MRAFQRFFRNAMRSRICPLAWTLVIVARSSGEIRYDDGGVHALNDVITDSVYVTEATELNYAGVLSIEGIRSVLPEEEAERIIAEGLGGPAVRVDRNGRLNIVNGIVKCGIGNYICNTALLVDGAVVQVPDGRLQGYAGSGAVELLNGSVFHFSGGRIRGVSEFTGIGIQAVASDVSITGGAIDGLGDQGHGIRIEGGSRLSISSGSVRAFGIDTGVTPAFGVLAEGSDVSMSGGYVESRGLEQSFAVSIQDGDLEIDGGEIFNLHEGSGAAVRVLATAQVTITGGEITAEGPSPENHVLRIGDSASAEVSGGAFSMRGWFGAETAMIRLSEQGRLRLSGGTFMPLGPAETVHHLLTQDSSYVEIVGSGFNYPADEPIADLEGTLSGIWPNGTPFELSFRREAGAIVIPVLVPEPAMMILVGPLALLLLALHRRRCR